MNPSQTPANALPILIAEDSPTQSLLLEHILRRRGFVVTAAGNGRVALEKLEAGLEPALVISDVQMPEMDGYQLCAKVKADPRLSHLPLMLLTSLSAPQDIIRGLECGADNFVVKPYEEEFLMARVEAILANRQLPASAGPEGGIAIFFAGQHYTISANRRQILTLLLSTYETAVKTNADLIKAHEELKAAQEQLIEAEKLQSVARLAAGVAHEVRNPLAILEMGIGFLSGQENDADNETILREMQEAVARANGVVSSLMELSPQEMGMREADLNGVITGALAALKKEIEAAGIAVKTDLAGELPPSRMDLAKMEQVFLNVFNNAIQAMPQGGELQVRTSVRELAEDDALFVAGDRSGAKIRGGKTTVVAEVRDTGSGVEPEKLGKVFEPFFSTKPTGQGMGLGLTVARKIVDLHHGTITFRNGPEGGAIVTVALPHS